MNTETHYLGKPCKRRHVTDDGKHTLRRKDNGNCPQCVSLVTKARFAARPEKYEGSPCEFGHTLRWRTGQCVECGKTHKRKWNQSAEGQEAQKRSHWKAAGLPEPTRPMPRGCEICSRGNGSKSLVNDHCHDTLLFRGWLCTSCNAAIGHLGDSLEGILRVAEYLRKNSPAV